MAIGERLNIAEKKIRNAIIEVCSAKTIIDSVIVFIKHEHLLNGCRFIFAAEDGMIPGLSINHNFSKRGAIRSLFKTNKVFVLDSRTLDEMHNDNGNASFPIDHSVSLDSHSFRYIRPYLQGEISKVPSIL